MCGEVTPVILHGIGIIFPYGIISLETWFGEVCEECDADRRIGVRDIPLVIRGDSIHSTFASTSVVTYPW